MSPLFDKTLGEYKSYLLTFQYSCWEPDPPQGRLCRFPSTLALDITYQHGTENWQGIDIAIGFPEKFKIEEFLNCPVKYIYDDRGAEINYLDSQFRIASVSQHENQSNKVFLIFEREYIDGGIGAIIRYRVCTAREIAEEFLVDWTKGPCERFKVEGKAGWLINDHGLKTFVYIEEKEILNEYEVD